MERIRSGLRDRIAAGNMAHAFLLLGPRGSDKRETALWIARAAVCEGDAGERPCGACEACRSFGALSDLDLRVLRPVDRPVWVSRESLERRFPGGDLIEGLGSLLEGRFLLPPLPSPDRRRLIPLRVDPSALFKKGRAAARADRSALERRIETSGLEEGGRAFLRELLQTAFSVEWYLSSIGIGHLTDASASVTKGEVPVIPFVSRKPSARRWKVVIFEEAERMTEAAQNALLKTLEEPPDDSLLLLTACRREGLLDTIRSRCELIRMPPPTAEESDAARDRYFIGLSEEEWEALLLFAEGVPGQAAEIDPERFVAERLEARALLVAARRGPMDAFFPALEKWAGVPEETQEETHLAAARRLSHVLLLARDEARRADDGTERFEAAERVFRCAHRAMLAARPGANLRLLLEEFGAELWRAEAPLRGGNPS